MRNPQRLGQTEILFDDEKAKKMMKPLKIGQDSEILFYDEKAKKNSYETLEDRPRL